MENLSFEKISQVIQSKIKLPDGFNCNENKKNSVIKFSFIQQDKIDSLILGFTHYNHFKLDSIVAGISFPKLNNAMTYLSESLNEENINIKNTISQISEGKESAINIYEKLPANIGSSEDLERSINLIQAFIDEIAISFYQKWTTLSDLIPLIENLNLKNLSQVFGGNGIVEKTIIMHLYNHTNTKSFLENLIQKYTNKSEEYPDEDAYQNMTKSLLNLKQALVIIPKIDNV